MQLMRLGLARIASAGPRRRLSRAGYKLATAAATVAIASALLAAPAMAEGNYVYGEGYYGGYTGPKSEEVEVVETESEGRTGEWCMNTYGPVSRETLTGLETHCQYEGKHREYWEGGEPPYVAIAQTWNDTSANGWLWGWVRYEGARR